MRSLFITGANGFIGGSLLCKLNFALWENVYCLSYRTPIPAPSHPNIHYIRAALDDTQVYAPLLAKCDTVIHLAAATGKARPEEFFRVNARGTERLVEQCESAGVRNFILLSTIAVKFPDISSYPYAQSKQHAERVLTQSRLSHRIIRPTIVIGKNGTTWKALSKIGRLPMPFVFGQGTNRIQPIFLEDLTDCLTSILEEDGVADEMLELGGPEVVAFQEFIQRIHFLYHKRRTRVLCIPARQISACLRFLEIRLPGFLPFTAGQLTAFTNDSTNEPNRISLRHSLKMKTVDQMLNEVRHNA